MSTTNAITTLMTAEEFFNHQCTSQAELVRGKIFEMNPPPGFRHGKVCGNIIFELKTFLVENDLGVVLGNDSGIITQQNPDTVRGADVAFYSYHRLPKGETPIGYATSPPELVFEVRSPSDRQGELLTKVGEYLKVGVDIVCLVNSDKEEIHIYTDDAPVQILSKKNKLTLRNILPGFEIDVCKLFA